MTLLPVHIAAGAIGIVAGFVALYVVKGAALHRKSGMVFVYSMLTMALLGAALAAIRHAAPGANIPIGLLTAYLVVTGLVQVRPPRERSRRLDIALMLAALAVSLTLFTFGLEAFASRTGRLYRWPPFPFFIFGSIGLVAAGGDLRLIALGGVHILRGTPRLARHLWRMSFALLIAAFSFFLGQAKVIPKPIRIFPLLAVPPLVVLATMLYWLWRVESDGHIEASFSSPSLRPRRHSTAAQSTSPHTPRYRRTARRTRTFQASTSDACGYVQIHLSRRCKCARINRGRSFALSSVSNADWPSTKNVMTTKIAPGFAALPCAVSEGIDRRPVESTAWQVCHRGGKSDREASLICHRTFRVPVRRVWIVFDAHGAEQRRCAEGQWIGHVVAAGHLGDLRNVDWNNDGRGARRRR